jgi:phosphomannomutase
LLLLAIAGGDSRKPFVVPPSGGLRGEPAEAGTTNGVVVLETETSRAVADRLEQLGMQVTRSSSHRADMYAAMREHGAMLGGGSSGRFWHADAGLPLCDALMTVTRLLMALSRGDEPLSKVLDRDAPLG